MAPVPAAVDVSAPGERRHRHWDVHVHVHVHAAVHNVPRCVATIVRGCVLGVVVVLVVMGGVRAPSERAPRRGARREVAVQVAQVAVVEHDVSTLMVTLVVAAVGGVQVVVARVRCARVVHRRRRLALVGRVLGVRLQQADERQWVQFVHG